LKKTLDIGTEVHAEDTLGLAAVRNGSVLDGAAVGIAIRWVSSRAAVRCRV